VSEGAFLRALAERQPDPAGRRWVFVPYDQLSDEIGPLAREEPRRLGIVLVESPWKAGRRPYHRQKLALVLASLRHFALEQAARGVAIRHLVATGPYRSALEAVTAELGPLRLMAPAERELRSDLAPLVKTGALEIVPHEGWLTTEGEFQASHPHGPPWRMDRFYRRVRRTTGILVRGGRPAGGRWSFDVENRRPWRGEPAAPAPPTFPRDPVKEEVAALIERRFGRHPGRLDLDALPATREDAERLWTWARAACLPWFGPFEDAMSVRSASLFHTRIAPLLNLHRLLPRRVVGDVAAMDLPIASQEGFVRQILGWREFVHHVHVATDGFRRLPGGKTRVRTRPGDGGYGRWAGRRWRWPGPQPAGLDGGAAPAGLGAGAPLPRAFWGAHSGLACLDAVVADVWREGYSHHITRLMVLANLATLLDVSPRELTDWFWVAYADAYDWVVEPNVLGMGAFAVGDVMTTKPYVAGAAYIDRMSDYCRGCAFDPGTTCPITPLYWAFLGRHRRSLARIGRLRVPLAALRRRDPARRRRDRAVFEQVRRTLGAGRPLRPATVRGARTGGGGATWARRQRRPA
jgi:deoxyribodipyrimidine photolyase-related protein